MNYVYYNIYLWYNFLFVKLFFVSEFNSSAKKDLKIIDDISNQANKAIRTQNYTALRKYHRNTMNNLDFGLLKDYNSTNDDLDLIFDDRDMKSNILDLYEFELSELVEKVESLNLEFNQKSTPKACGRK